MINALAAAVTTQTFIAHTAVDLEDEEMEVTTPHSHYTQPWAYSLLCSHSPNGTCPSSCLNPPGGIPTEDLGRRRDGHAATEGQGHTKPLLNVLAQQTLDILVTIATSIHLAITSFILIGSSSPLDTWPLPCNRPTGVPFTSLHTSHIFPSPTPRDISSEGPNGMHILNPAY